MFEYEDYAAEPTRTNASEFITRALEDNYNPVSYTHLDVYKRQKNVRGAMLFNILSYMSDRLLTIGNTTAALDELYG